MSRGQAGGMAEVFCPGFAGVVCRGHAQDPAFASGSLGVSVGCFGLFASFIQNLPQLGMHSYF